MGPRIPFKAPKLPENAPLVVLMASSLPGPAAWDGDANVLRLRGRDVVVSPAKEEPAPRTPVRSGADGAAGIEPGHQLPVGSRDLDILPGWRGTPAVYLAFCKACAEEQHRARACGWRVTTVAGQHLHMLMDPERDAAEITALVNL